MFKRLMNKVFLNQAWRTIKAYIDDILVWTAPDEDHVRDLEEMFKNIKKVSLWLKGRKCIFGVQEGQFLDITR